MKRNSFKAFMGFFISFLILSSCTLLKDLDYTVTPSPLEMHGDSIKFSVTVNVPEKGINKSVKAEITPKLGDKALGVWTIQGTKIQGNGKTIDTKAGGTATFETSLAYDPSLEAADLVLTGKIYKGAKSKEKGDLPSAKIADATIVTPLLARMTCTMCTQSDELVRVVDKSVNAMINYNKGKSLVKSQELKDDDIVALVSWIAASQENEKLDIQSISIRGYASPDGEFAKNGDLSTERVESAAKAFSKLMTKAKLEAFTDITSYDQKGLGEDFEEFKKQLAATDAISEGDKNLFIRVLEMEKDPEKREAEMVRLGKSYTQLEKDVFPNIRRAVITVNYKESGLTDEEMIAFATNKTDTLTVEEVLFTGETLLKDLNSRISLYAAVAEKMNDSRVYNNLGSLYYVQNDILNAIANFEASAELNASGEVMNNLAAISMLDGDREKSRELFAKAKGMDADKMNAVKANTAGLDILDGAYASAEGNISENTFNKALAQLLQGNLSEAEATLAESDDKNDADGLYLAAVMAARGGTGASDVVAKLKLAIEEDASFKAKAGKDREFVKFFEDAAFQALVK
jgi:tetratricopeptide (TPR) repeat protein